MCHVPPTPDIQICIVAGYLVVTINQLVTPEGTKAWVGYFYYLKICTKGKYFFCKLNIDKIDFQKSKLYYSFGIIHTKF